LKIVRPLHGLYLEMKKRAGERVYECEGAEHIGSEEQSVQVDIVHRLLETADYIENSNTHAWLSIKADEIISKQAVRSLYIDLLKTTADIFDLTYFTRLESVRIIQDSLPFQLHLMKKREGRKITASIIAENLLGAFPEMLDVFDFSESYFTPLKWLETAVDIEIFDRFCIPFGLVTISPDEDTASEDRIFAPKQYQLTPLFNTLFRWKV